MDCTVNHTKQFSKVFSTSCTTAACQRQSQILVKDGKNIFDSDNSCSWKDWRVSLALLGLVRRWLGILKEEWGSGVGISRDPSGVRELKHYLKMGKRSMSRLPWGQLCLPASTYWSWDSVFPQRADRGPILPDDYFKGMAFKSLKTTPVVVGETYIYICISKGQRKTWL